MGERELHQHLSQIATQWSVLYEAHRGGHSAAARARQLLMQRYCGAVYRYLLSAVREPAVAEDLTQEFALRFVQGRFEHADPSQGRFRNYVKAALFRLVQDHHRGQGRRRALSLDDGAPVADPRDDAAERDFRESWRQELLSRAWEALSGAQAQTGQPYHDVLRLRADRPELSSAEMAEATAAKLGRPMSAANLRQLLHRGRERFAELLLDEVCQSLETTDEARVLEELAELNLLKYCQDALARRKPG